jgi:hypothetical protein
MTSPVSNFQLKYILRRYLETEDIDTAIRNINNIRKPDHNDLSTEQAQELFEKLFLKHGDQFRCSNCGDELNQEIGEKCTLLIDLDVGGPDPTAEYPIVEMVCPNCYDTDYNDMTLLEWRRVGLKRRWL